MQMFKELISTLFTNFSLKKCAHIL